MQLRALDKMNPGRDDAFEEATTCERGPSRECFRRCENRPWMLSGRKSSTPFRQTSLPHVNLLSTTDESDYHAPIWTAAHDSKHRTGLGFDDPPFLGDLPRVPGSLGLVENHNRFRGRSGYLCNRIFSNQ